MPKPKAFANAFTGTELARMSGLSGAMVNYLAASGFLQATYRPGAGARGSTRYYSYRDLMIARVIGRLAHAGVELKRLKEALIGLQAHEMWKELGPSGSLPLLVVSGGRVLLPGRDGAISDLTMAGQLAFAFVLDLADAERDLLAAMDDERRRHFSYEIRPLLERTTAAR